MSETIIKHNILEEKISISFDLQGFNNVDLDIQTDIDLNPLLIKLTKIIEVNKKLKFEFEDKNQLLQSFDKIKLIRETLIEIYDKFNDKINIEIDSELSINEQIEDDDLPF